jgi:hypothetical protein
VVAWLGYGGLLPFVGLAALSWLPGAGLPVEAPAALRFYGASILSFVGALHWGFAMNLVGLDAASRDRLYLWSVVPSLLAWVALCVPPAWGTGLLVAGFLAHYAQDHALRNRASLPGWYLPLRGRLTAVAVVSLLAAAWR